MNLPPRTESRLHEIVVAERERRRKESEMPPEVRALLEDASRASAEFVLVEPLGRGGAGEVWKAWDRSLCRWVAVKMPAEAPDPERFRNEALAAARLSHPNIVPVHRISEFRGRPCIVMALVDGRSLAEARPPLGEAVAAVRAAALAVQYAHEQGVVHRDLKPGNLMRDGRGGVWVLDFGLAYLLQGGTRPGAGGTPAFMSPEQARGDAEAREPATDIYSLGATLYDLATGEPPFPGSRYTEVAARVLREEPRPTPGLDPRIRAAILRAMSKDPRARHPSAAAFAQELGEYLEGARPGRRRLLAAGIGAAAVAALVFGLSGLFRPTGLEAVRKVARLALDAALQFRRVGANDRMRTYLPDLEAAYREAAGHAEVEYLMGRMYRALMDDERALDFQERALRKDPAYAPALYERVVLTSRKYRRELRRAHEAARALEGGGITAREARQVPLQSLEEVERSRPDLVRLRERVVRDVRALEGARGITPSAALVAKAILAYHVGQYAEAREMLEELVGKEPLLEEAWETLARAAHLRMAEGPEELERRWEEAEHWYTQGIIRDRGYLPHWFGRSDVLRERANYRARHGDDPLPDFRAAEENLTQAAAMDRGSAEARLRRGLIRAFRAIYLMNRGQDPLGDLGEAEGDLSQAIGLEERNGEAWARRGFVRAHRGIHRLAAGEDPSRDFAEAEADFARAQALDPALAGLWMWRGYMRTHRGIFRFARGEDPKADYDQAERDLTEALRLDRQYAAAWKNRGYARTHRGAARAAQGEDPGRDFADAEEDLSETLRLDREYAAAWKNRGFVRTHRGAWLFHHGGDPRADFESADEDFGHAIELDRAHGEAWVQRAAARAWLGRAREGKGDRPGAAESYERAAEDYAEAIRLNPLLARVAGDGPERAAARARELRGK